MKNILFIVNPVSGKLKARTATFDALSVFCREGWNVRTALTQHRGHAAELAKSAVVEGFDAVVCCGGDGTLNEVISGLIQNGHGETSLLPLGYIPCGSTNDFANTLGISSNPLEAAKAIVNGDLRTIDIGRFGKKRYFSYIASIGAFTAASYNAPQDIKNVFGHFAYVIEGMRSLADIRPEHIHVIADGNEYEGEFIFCSVSNTTSAGGIVKLSPEDIDLNDGKFELMLIHYPNDALEISDIITGITINDFSGPMFEFIKAKELDFIYKGNKAWTLDGEKAESKDGVQLVNLHSAIQIFI